MFFISLKNLKLNLQEFFFNILELNGYKNIHSFKYIALLQVATEKFFFIEKHWKNKYKSLRTMQMKMFFLLSTCDISENWQINFQDVASPIMEGIVNLHHDITFYLCLIFIFVLWMVIRIVFFNNVFLKVTKKTKPVTHNTIIEFIWTLVPILILLLISMPSMTLLYTMDDVKNPSMTIKVIGNQWYWSYEFSSVTEQSLMEINEITLFHNNKLGSFDSIESELMESRMLLEDDLQEGDFRLLLTDFYLILPIEENIRILVTASDVLHSWAVPSLGLKMDACPGRLNQTAVFLDRPGVYFGQCSELCGIDHGFMPIMLVAQKRAEI